MSANEPRTDRTALPANVKVLGWASFLNDVASEMVFPLLPQFLLVVLGGNRFFLGVMEGLIDSLASIVKLWSGAWSDRAGARKAFVVCGYAAAAVARPAIGLVRVPWQLLVVRAGDRFGKGVRTSPRDALIADSTAPVVRGRAFGFTRGMDHLGAAVGPLLAAGFLWLYPDQLRSLFFLTLVPGLLVVALVVFGLREKQPTARGGQPFAWTLRPFDRRFKLYLLALLVFTMGNSSDAFLLVRAGELGVATPLLPLLWCVFHVAKSGGNVIAGRAVDRVGAKPMILAGWAVYAGVYLAFAVASLPIHAWLLFLGYALFYALTEPAEKTLVASLVAPQRTGLAYGWYNFAIGIATLPASLMFGWLYQEYGALTAFGCGAALAAVAAILLVGVRPEQEGTIATACE